MQFITRPCACALAVVTHWSSPVTIHASIVAVSAGFYFGLVLLSLKVGWV